MFSGDLFFLEQQQSRWWQSRSSNKSWRQDTWSKQDDLEEQNRNWGIIVTQMQSVFPLILLMLGTVLKGWAFSCSLAVKTPIKIFNQHPLGVKLFRAHTIKKKEPNPQLCTETSADCTIKKMPGNLKQRHAFRDLSVLWLHRTELWNHDKLQRYLVHIIVMEKTPTNIL